MKVTLVAHTPNPDQVCDMAARTCTSQACPELSMAVNKTKALQHALESGHESVAEHATFTFQVEGISRACSHQLVRHRLASYSQQSQRYVYLEGFSYVIPKTIEENFDAAMEYHDIMGRLSILYSELIDSEDGYGIPEEDARYILPNACTTNITVSMNARELRHFFSERCCTRAQWEIRELAERMLQQVREVAPVLFEDAGPKCQRLGHCPEAKGCGLMKPKEAKE